MPRSRTGSLLMAGMLSAIAGWALADGPVFAPDGPASLATLVRFDDRDYRIVHDEAISLTPLSQSTVRKIGYGRETLVNVVTTASGTYSSDGLTSPHVLYPGIVVTAVTDATPVATPAPAGAWLAHGAGHSSFLDLQTGPDGDFVFVASDAGSTRCHLSRSFAHCFSR